LGGALDLLEVHSRSLDQLRVARCPVFNRTVRYFCSLSGIILIVTPENTCVNSSIVCAKDTGTASVRYLGEIHLATLDQPQKMNWSALLQSGRIGPPNYCEQRTRVYDGLHMRREGGRARADRRAPSQTSTATPRTRSCKRCAVGMEASAIH